MILRDQRKRRRRISKGVQSGAVRSIVYCELPKDAVKNGGMELLLRVVRKVSEERSRIRRIQSPKDAPNLQKEVEWLYVQLGWAFCSCGLIPEEEWLRNCAHNRTSPNVKFITGQLREGFFRGKLEPMPTSGKEVLALGAMESFWKLVESIEKASADRGLIQAFRVGEAFGRLRERSDTSGKGGRSVSRRIPFAQMTQAAIKFTEDPRNRDTKIDAKGLLSYMPADRRPNVATFQNWFTAWKSWVPDEVIQNSKGSTRTI